MRKNIYFLAALLLLLTACGESQSPAVATDGNAYATDGNYVYYAEPMATDGNAYDYSVQSVPYATPGNVEAAKLATVYVSTVEELLSAIAPETEILLAPGEYNLSQCTPGLYNYCYFHPTFPMDDESGNELVLCNLHNCIIASESGKCEDVTLIAEPRTAAVLTVEDSSGIQLRGLTLGHTEGAICSGGVLSLKRSGSIYMEDCELYGCGTIALNCESCWGVTARGGLFRDCSYNAVELMDCESVLLDGVTVRKCGDNMVLNVMRSHWVQVKNCAFEQNLPLNFLCESWSDHVFFDDCSFTDNSFYSLFSLMNCAPPQLNGCNIPYEQYLRPYENTATGVVALQDGKEWE